MLQQLYNTLKKYIQSASQSVRQPATMNENRPITNKKKTQYRRMTASKQKKKKNTTNTSNEREQGWTGRQFKCECTAHHHHNIAKPKKEKRKDQIHWLTYKHNLRNIRIKLSKLLLKWYWIAAAAAAAAME